jgi:hypothetical protein
MCGIESFADVLRRDVFSPIEIDDGAREEFLLATTAVGVCPRQSHLSREPQKIFANETLYQLSYTPETLSLAKV